jgi:tetratricopeptide (TPR) repeat protein
LKNSSHVKIPFTNRLRIIFLAFLIAVSFHNVLQNDFIGDDKALFGQNRFYKSLENFPKIFTRQLVMSAADFQLSREVESFSGCISYRPVSAATFFVDYAVWKGSATGQHFTNIFLHFLVTVLAFYFFVRLTANPSLAFLAAALFAVHPVQTEAINTIGYRSDILMALFSLAAILAYWRYSADGKKGKWLLLCAGSYVLAVFSKETAVVVPVLILILERFFIAPDQRRTIFKILHDNIKIFVTFSTITAFYIYVYFVLMPNPVYLQSAPQSQTGFAQLIVALKIFSTYLGALILPTAVSILPPLYGPAVYPLEWWHIALPSAVIIGSIVFALRFTSRDKIVAFGILWFFLAYLPVCGIVPLLNPLAYRFLYLPSIGFFLIAAVGINMLCQRIMQAKISPNMPLLVKGAVIGLCVALTVSTNSFYKNDIVTCREMIRRYPDCSRPYWILGLEYYRLARYSEAVEFLQKHLTTPTNNPFISDDKEKFLTYHLLGIASQDPDVAIDYLQKARAIYPGLVQVNLDLAKSYLAKKNYAAALALAQDAVERDSKLSLAYVFIVHIHTETGNWAQAHRVLDQAVIKFGETPQLKAVKEHLNQKENTP